MVLGRTLKISHLFILGKIGKEKVFDDILRSEKSFFGLVLVKNLKFSFFHFR